MPLDRLTSRCSCSMKMNVRIVFGLQIVSDGSYAWPQESTYASRIQAGVQPLMRNRGPSFRNDSTMILLTLCQFCQLLFNHKYSGYPRTGFTPSTVTAFWILLFRTSAGAQAVVATVPASNEARKCVGIPSLRPREGFDNSWCLAAEYLGSVITEKLNGRHGEHTLLSEKHLCYVSDEIKSEVSTLTHNDRANDIRTETSGEGAHPFFPADSYNRIEGMIVSESLCGSLCTVCTHSYESDLDEGQ